MVKSGISKDGASKLLELLGLEVGGRPGRPSKDYSREHKARKAGLSWATLASKTFKESPELQQEFGSDDFNSLTFEQKDNLKNRIREGVKSHERKLASPSRSSLLPPADSQKNQ
jgi:hypothetical protein